MHMHAYIDTCLQINIHLGLRCSPTYTNIRTCELKHTHTYTQVYTNGDYTHAHAYVHKQTRTHAYTELEADPNERRGFMFQKEEGLEEGEADMLLEREGIFFSSFVLLLLLLLCSPSSSALAVSLSHPWFSTLSCVETWECDLKIKFKDIQKKIVSKISH